MFPTGKKRGHSYIERGERIAVTPRFDRVLSDRVISNIESKASSQKDKIKKKKTSSVVPSKRRTNKKKVEGLSIRIPVEELSSMLIPVIPYQEWKNAVKGEVVRRILYERDSLLKVRQTPPSEELIQGIIGQVHATSLLFSSILTRIKEATKILVSSPKTDFLATFKSYGNPKEFLKQYNDITDEQRKLLGPIMGAKEAKKILDMHDEKLKKKSLSFLDKVLECEPERIKICRQKFIFDKGFDFFHSPGCDLRPLCFILHENIAGTFRAFTNTTKASPEHFQFNGKPLASLPDYSTLTEVKEILRPNHFIGWLISNLQESMEMKREEKISLQLKAFFQPPAIDKESLRKIWIATFTEYIKFGQEQEEERYQIILLQRTFEGIAPPTVYETYKDSYSFRHIWNRLKKEFQDFRTQLIKAADYLVEAVLPSISAYQYAKKHIRTLPVLKAFGISAYSFVEIFLRQTLCPNLYKDEVGHLYLHYTPTDLTNYSVQFNKEEGTFSVCQGRRYTINRILEQRKRKVIATITITWTLHGSFEKPEEYRGELGIKSLDFEPSTDVQVRKEVFEHFQGYPPSFWGGHVTFTNDIVD